MKEDMGMHHSSLSCERLSNSIQNCFGLNSNRSYQAQTSKPSNLSNSSLCTGNSLNESTSSAYAGSLRVKQKSSLKSSCPRDSCCCKGADEDKDGFSYNICSQSADSQLNPTVSVTSSSSSLSPIQPQQSHSRSRDYKSTNHDNSGKSSPEALNRRSTGCNGTSSVDHAVKDMSVFTNSEGSSVRTVINASDYEAKEIIKQSSFAENSQSDSLRKDSQKRASLLKQETLLIDNGNRSAEVSDNDSKTLQLKDNSEVSSQASNSLADTQHFRKLVSMETDRLNLSIDNWNAVLADRSSRCPVEVCGEIRTVIGQTRLVISERFVQFSKLVDQADGVHAPTDGLPVLLSDLQGFWDMIYFQVQDVDSKFARLANLQSRGWSASSAPGTPNNKAASVASRKPKGTQPAKKRPAKKKAVLGSEEDKKRREAARKRLAEARKALARRNQADQDISVTSSSPEILTPPNFVADDVINHQEEHRSDNKVLRKRPDSIVDPVSCAVAVGSDTLSLSSISSTSLVH